MRAWDAAAGELTIDFVHHGDAGVAGPWAAAARPGDRIQFMGPGGAYRPHPDADSHLLAGDEAALPAIAAALHGLPAGTRALAFVEVAGPEEEQHDLPLSPGTELRWLHRGDAAPGEVLVAAVRAAELPAGGGHLFVHGVVAHHHLHRQVVPGVVGACRVGREQPATSARPRATSSRMPSGSVTVTSVPPPSSCVMRSARSAPASSAHGHRAVRAAAELGADEQDEEQREDEDEEDVQRSLRNRCSSTVVMARAVLMTPPPGPARAGMRRRRARRSRASRPPVARCRRGRLRRS